jgi:hypothetical protein
MIVYTGCNTKKPKAQPSNDTGVETIDFFGFETEESDNIPEALIKSKEYIKLDYSSDDFLFKGIDKIKICGDRIFIMDRQVRKLIVFDKNGKGIGLVGHVGQGPGEYVRVHEFDVDQYGNIFLIDGTSDRLFVYNKNLEFVSVKRMPFESTMLRCLPDNKLMFGLSHWNNGDNKSRKIAITDTTMKTEHVYLQYDEYFDDRVVFGTSRFANAGDKILYNQAINDSVYEFSQDGKLSNTYFFDFGKRSLPNDYKKELETNMNKFDKYCFLTDFIVVDGNYILGRIYHKAHPKNFIIARNSKTLHIYSETAGLLEYYDNKIISCIFPSKYKDINKIDLPEDVKKHVENENFVICINTLK